MSVIVRFNEFSESSVYNLFREIDVKEPSLSNLEPYEQLILHIQAQFICVGVPGEDCINTYINKYDKIAMTNMERYHLFVKVLFEKAYTNIKELRSQKKKEDKNMDKTINAEAKAVKRVAKEEALLKKQMEIAVKREEKEQKKLIKDNEKDTAKILSKSIVRCICGVEHIYSSTHIHMVSGCHANRMDAIIWYKSTLDNI